MSSTPDEIEELSKKDKIQFGLTIFGVLAILIICMKMGMSLMSELYGPYWMVLADTGPVMISRGGSALISMTIFMGLVAIAIGIAAKTIKPFLFVLLVQISTVMGYGYYLNNIVYWQGLEDSEMFLKFEIGLAQDEELEPHIKQVLKLSYELSEKGEATWKPFDWKGVDWPVNPY